MHKIFGFVTKVRGIFLFGPLVLSLWTNSAQADDLAYLATPNAGGSTTSFGTVDLNTGFYTQINGQMSTYIGSLAEFGGKLYGMGGSNLATLYQIDTGTGTLTTIGTATVQLAFVGSTTTGIYAIVSEGGIAILYSINPSTGAATSVGSTGITMGTSTGGLSVGAQGLYFMASSGTNTPITSRFYSLNTATGAPALIATLTVGVCMKSMTAENGKLYVASGYCTSGSGIYTIDPGTGQTTFIANGSGFYDVNGLAPIIGNGVFDPITPCRVVDTRNLPGTFGGPTLQGGLVRSFPLPSGTCGIPSNAIAYALNITVVPQGPLEYLTIWPTGQIQPLASTLNALQGQIVANAAIVQAGLGGAVSVFVTNTTDVIIDITGYFVPLPSSS